MPDRCMGLTPKWSIRGSTRVLPGGAHLAGSLHGAYAKVVHQGKDQRLASRSQERRHREVRMAQVILQL